MNYWYRLTDKDIISCMIGDMELDPYLGFVPLKMPYMKGIDICDFGKKLGMAIDYEGNNSRSEYMKEVLEYCITHNKIKSFLDNLLDLKHFKKELKELDSSEIMYKYGETKTAFLNKVNCLLMFEDLFLEYDGNNYSIKSINNEKIELASEKIDHFDSNYAHEMFKNSLIEINNGNYDSAITKIRTMIEEILLEGLKRKGIEKEFNGNIKAEYGEFKKNYNMHIQKEMDDRTKKLLSGLETIIDSIAEMRNANSDSHGVGDKRIKIERHHAILFYNSGVALAEFLLSVMKI